MLVSVFTTDVPVAGELKISVEKPDTLDLFKQWIIYYLAHIFLSDQIFVKSFFM